MRPEFLSEEWFAVLDELRATATKERMPAEPVINITIRRGPGDDVHMALVGGLLDKGHRAESGTTVILPVDLARRFFVDGDQLAGMQGFMAGQVRVEGDATGLRALHGTEPTASWVALRQKLRDVTG